MSAVKRFLLGSVADRVVRRATCDVLCLNGAGGFWSWLRLKTSAWGSPAARRQARIEVG
jgi:hypothetical protein